MATIFLGRSLRTATMVIMLGGLAVSACSPARNVNNQTIGAGVGALGGALVGSTLSSGSGRTVATIVGGLVGAFVGSEIGRSMDERDRLLASQTVNQALETGYSGSEYEWCNPDNQHCGVVRPQPAYRTSGHQHCRDYTHTVRIEGRSETIRGTACRQRDGSWKDVS